MHNELGMVVSRSHPEVVGVDHVALSMVMVIMMIMVVILTVANNVEVSVMMSQESMNAMHDIHVMHNAQAPMESLVQISIPK
jgi:hypothetical protein